MTLAAAAAASALLPGLVAGSVREEHPALQEQVLAVARYSVAAVPWSAALGHHRAIVEVREPSEAVRARISWRRRDRDPDAKDIVILNSASGERVANVARVDIRREYGDIVFEATRAGTYEVYYLPYDPEPTRFYYAKGYRPPANTADAHWLASHAPATGRTAGPQWEPLPEARVIGLQARSAFDSFYPMEVVATRAEVAKLADRYPEPFLLFPEDRSLPIRMPDDVPVRWVERGPSSEFTGKALRNEYYAFQIGVFAARGALSGLTVTFQDLRSTAGKPAIAAERLHCLNTGGVDTSGRPFRKRVDVPKGGVQPLWIGVDVPKALAAGDYVGRIEVAAENAAAQSLSVRLSVQPEVLEDRGDGEPWRHSRLRWLDSTAGADDNVVAPYTPLKVSGRTVACLGRTVRFGGDGLPAGIKAGATEVLAEPIQFVVNRDGGDTLRYGLDGASGRSANRARVVIRKPGLVVWEAEGDRAGLRVLCRAAMEFDGHTLYRLTLKAVEDVRIGDAALEMPIRPDVARYFMGAGRKGGRLPTEYDWRWSTPHDSFWVGDVRAGVHCELRGGAYNGPLLNLFRPAPPATWSNGGRGGVTLLHRPGAVVVRAYSGAREMKAGDEITYEFALIPTPVKPLDTARAFHYRYYHGGDEPVVDQSSLDAGINVINIHHANAVNPYINYPFLTVGALKALVQEWQERGMAMKLYYTVRELSNYMVELWALRSLGSEVLAGGPGGGFPWLREHLGSDYTTQWYVPFPDGSADAALLNSGETRWYNYYVEGLGWLVDHVGIDGLYLDDVSYDRRILKRMRKVMAARKPGCMIDLHSNTAFSIGPANQYMEYMPYVDKVWFGESFRYNEEPPDYWLTEISGIPFGVMGEMLHSPTNAYRGMVYGITTRITWGAQEGPEDPRPIYRLWNDFGIEQSRMIGYWDDTCPVRTDNQDVLATVYVRKGKALIALASWAAGDTAARLRIDWKALGVDPRTAVLRAPAVTGVQEATTFAPDAAIPIKHLKGWMLVLEDARQ